MSDHESVSKAIKNGKRGKFRRVDGGKMKFIRSEDGVVEKDVTSAAGHDAAIGSPAAEVMATSGAKKAKALCKCGTGMEKCGCKKVEKNASTCDCTHEGVCKEDANCNCDCTDRETCRYRISDDAKDEGSDPIKALDAVVKALAARAAGEKLPEGVCPTCGRE